MLKRFAEAQRTAELPSALRVSSTASSIATGSIARLVAPMTAMIANRPPVSPARTTTRPTQRQRATTAGRAHAPAQISASHAPPRNGQSTFTVIARWFVNTRSNSGAVTAVLTIPTSSSVAPISPEIVSEYPYGDWRACKRLRGRWKGRDVPATAS